MKNLLEDRRWWGIFIIAGATLLGLVLVFQSSGKDKNLAQKEKQEKFYLEKGGEQLGVADVDDLSRFLTSQSKKNNLTESFANLLGQRIIQENDGNDDPTNNGLLTPNSQQLLAAAVDDYSDEFNIEADFIGRSALNISADNSNDSILSYYSQYKTILEKNREKAMATINLEAFSKEKNTIYLLPIIEGLDNLILEMKKLKTPSSFATLQLKTVNFYIAEKSIFGAVSLFNEDPLRAMTALKLLEGVEADLEKLGNDYAVLLRQYGFKVVQGEEG